jgi:homoserine O-acetyltransferase
VTGVWRDGDDPGGRLFADLGALRLGSGAVLPQVRVAYETWGRLSPARDNAVLVLHALTGDSHLAGPASPAHPSPGWWDPLVGPGRPLDVERWFVVVPNVLGGCQGTTGPSSPAPDGRAWGSRFPRISVADQVRAEAALADRLGIEQWAGVIGGSMGGMRALEWAVGYPDRVRSALLLAVGGYATADQIALQSVQVQAIRSDPGFAGGDYHTAPPGGNPHAGLGVARRLAHISYRSGAELESRFGRSAQPGEDPLHGGRFAVQSYLDHQADKLVRRFDAGSYVTLTEAMNDYDTGRGRGGLAAALARVRARTVVAGIDSDRLYPLPLQQELARLLPGCEPLQVVHSPHGHDGFLLETTAVGALVRSTLGSGEQPRRPCPAGAGGTAIR